MFKYDTIYVNLKVLSWFSGNWEIFILDRRFASDDVSRTKRINKTKSLSKVNISLLTENQKKVKCRYLKNYTLL